MRDQSGVQFLSWLHAYKFTHQHSGHGVDTQDGTGNLHIPKRPYHGDSHVYPV